jgi:hypothetical protein
MTTSIILTLFALLSGVPDGEVVCASATSHQCATRYKKTAVLLFCSGVDESLICLPLDAFASKYLEMQTAGNRK